RIDRRPPTVAFAAPVPPGNAAGCNTTSGSLPPTTADARSGVASTTRPSPVVLTTEGRGATQSVTVTDVAGNRATFTSPVVNIDKTPPTVACVPVPRQKGEGDEVDGRGLFRVTASDLLSRVTTITLGAFQLADGEIIQIRSTKTAGVRLVGKSDDDDQDDPRMRRFRVGPGGGVINATDAAGNV